MTEKNILFPMTLALSLLFFTAGIGFAQEAASNKDNSQVMIKGKIGYMESLGGYYVLGDDPPSELFIVNKNQKILKKLKNGGKTHTIKGHLTIGADHLMIEKIDGKDYFADKPK
jgi:hypothetical protein